MSEAVIIGAKRTPIGSFLGSLSSLSAPSLAATAIKAAICEAKIQISDIDEVIMGQVLQGGVGQAPARQAALSAGLLSSTHCTTVNKVCGSGLKALMLAQQSIVLKESNFVVAGGMESMSQAPYFINKARTGFRMGEQIMHDLMIHDGLWDPYGNAHMGQFGDQCAKEHSFTRQAQDEFAKESYRKALKAQEQRYFEEEIVPVNIKNKREEYVVSFDEEPSRFLPEKFAQLKAVFSKEGTVTAANASKINDGAAALVIGSQEQAQKRSLPVLGRIIASTTFAHEPQWFTTAPAESIKKLCQKASISVEDIDLFEINEAFAVVALYAIKELGLDESRVNVFGGAIGLGHPIGCSGARLVITLLNALRKKSKRLGCVSLCLGGGEAVSMLIERVA
ncbi:MAG: thiolase family protein [Myxococcales bacterium]|nr:thiolase family protein [Myxococcales bacterium]USN51899.1 MAG: thiolase family protein [Myxococcales bacterium]